MKRPRGLFAGVSALSSLFGGLLLTACPGSGFTTDHLTTGGGNGAGCEGDPRADTSLISEQCGVFVSPLGSDTEGKGTETSPFASLTKAISIAKNSQMRVFACAGELEGQVTVPAGITIHGGFDCAKEWQPSEVKTVLRGQPDRITLRLQADPKGLASISIDHFRFEAANAEKDGGSSIAALAEEGAIADFSDCELVAGNGMLGKAGIDAPDAAPMTPTVDVANQGKGPLCNPGAAVSNGGGEQFKNTACDATDVQSIGGAGGDGTLNNGQEGQPGLPNLGAGLAGQGGKACNGGGQGGGGNDGMDGAPGAKGQGLGALSKNSGWVGASGGSGMKGEPGQGGGGGGGQAGAMNCLGASGGAGGAGGCGGKGGGGGQAGGSSIALVMINATVTMSETVSLMSGSGGSGGYGGSAQTGGKGVVGGNGGSVMSPFVEGCNGGKGGTGGAGGPGGGGAGGHSLGVAYSGNAPSGGAMISVGSMGAGGKGGTDNTAMNNGDNGVAAQIQEISAQSGM